MLKFSDAVSDHIRFRLQSLDESTLDSALRDLLKFAEYGVEGSILLLQSCLDYLNIDTEDLNMHLQAALSAILKHLMNKPNFTTVLCLSVNSEIVNEGYLEKLCCASHSSVTEKVSIGLALSESENMDIRKSGKNFCIAQIEDLSANAGSMKSVEQIQRILMFLLRSDDLRKHADSFMQMLSLVQPKDDLLRGIAPLLSDELRDDRNLDLLLDGKCDDFDAILAEMEKEISMGDVIKELGYGCTASEVQCTEILSRFPALDEVTIAKVLGFISHAHVDLQDSQTAAATFSLALAGSVWSDTTSPSSWNMHVLVDSIRQLAPGTNWISVIENLDHEGFYLPNEDALTFLMSVYRHTCQEPFPLQAICGTVWKNIEGQLSFLKYAVAAPPEVFTFAHSSRQLAYRDAFCGHTLQPGHANHAWLCIDLLTVLCQLAERGHANSIRSILEYPLKYCPEVLLLGMAHVNTAYGLIQSEVSFTIFPLIIKNADCLGMIHYLWHVNPILVLRGFADAGLDPDCMARILDICQELKIVSPVLETIPSSVGIRLASLASKKELVDLENWLNTNFNAYKNSFFEECLEFLKQIEFDTAARGFNHSVGVLSLYLEAAPVFIKILRAQTGIASQKQMEELETICVTLTRSNAGLQNGGTADAPNSEGYGEDIEAEANSYFQQMFSGQLTVDSMVQMLTRFKESSLRREQSICDCMIGNLFEEYRFFPKYPERQLKIAAVLFGSVIKHQLVTHLMLGIALRYVLDALRKPADSKMFVFGTKALEQFVDRLIEWPQYCNHILQISHMRGTHPDIVAFIERTLARISSSHLESDGNHTITSMHHVPAQASIGNELNSSTSAIVTQQLTSPFQLQQRLETTSEERQKAAVAPSSNDLKSEMLGVGKLPGTTAESSSNQKNAVNVSGPLSSSPGFVRPSRGATSARFGSALNIETLIAAAEKRDTPIEVPASEAQDKMSFIINNLSAANVEAKAKEFTDILKEQHYPWFAQYMVMKRASIEPNFHDLYLKFLDKVNSKALNKEVVQATYENCKVLLGSDLIKSSSEERSLLKNLGSWLGKLTIGRNQVLRAREIDPKLLIIEAYEKGKMIAVIPFTSKILEPCQNSLAYQPPNPWTMGILGLLAEIYLMPNLKMNLKFDIEVLFKNLGVDMKDINPTALLKDRVREIEGNPDFSNKDVGASQPSMVAEVKAGIIPPVSQADLSLKVATSESAGRAHLLSQYAAPLHLSSGALMDDEKLSTLGLSDQLPSAQGLLQAAQSQSSFSVNQHPTPSLTKHVVINPKLSSLGLHVHFQRVVPIAMDRAIKEIVPAIVQRSVTIATQTSKELVMKDYALETDETRIHNAAHLMVGSLAGSLAHVTCKEPLRASISSQLRNSLQGLGLNISNELLEQAVQLVTNDNLDLGCAVIEQAATEKAVKTIDAEIGQRLSLRRNHREGVAPSFYDTGVFAQGSMGVLPEALRPKPGHLSLSQQRVYEDFVRLPLQSHSSQGIHSLPAGHSTSLGSAPSSTYDMASGSLPGYPPASSTSGIDGMPRAQDVPSEGIDTTGAPYFSGSSTHVAIDGGMHQHASDKSSTIASMASSVSASELNPLETTSVAKEFSTPQALPSPAVSERLGSSILEPSLQPRDALDKYQIVAQKLDDLVTSDTRDAEVQRVIAEVPEIILRCRSRDEAALAVAQKVFKGLYENAANSFLVGAHLAILAAIRDVCKLVVKELTSWVIYSDEDRKFNKEITLGLIRSELLNLAEYNLHMAKLIDGGRNKDATEFAISLMQTLALEQSTVVSELQSLVEALAKLATKPGSPDSLLQLLENLRNPGANMGVLSGISASKEDNGKLSKDKKTPGSITMDKEEGNYPEVMGPDPAGLSEQVSSLLMEWYGICELPGSNDIACSRFILKLHQSGFLKGDEMTDRFFRCLTEFAVAHCLSSEGISSGSVQQSPQQPPSLSFLAIDTYAKLLFSILKYGHVELGANKLLVLQRAMTVTIKYILKDAEEKKASFNPRPYFRLFINWLLDLNSLETAVDGANFQILVAFANAFHALQPLKVPSFSFAWLELVCHRSFMPKILMGNSQKGWPYFQRLLVDLFQFMEPFLRNAELGIPVHFLYKGTLRVLLVLLHDFPEFLCDYHFSFCDVIPPSCIQMRNIILSAFPRNMRLPDPSTPNLKIDLLAEISLSPRILSEVDAALKAKNLKADIDEYLKVRQPGSQFLSELKQRLLLLPSDAAVSGTRYDVSLINSLVLYVGMQAIQQLQVSTAHAPTPVNPASLADFFISAALDIFQALIVDLDTEGRYLFLNAVANQLRYPNTHTHYFSFVLLFLFDKTNQEIIQEQITRVLFERLIVNRPHPWGLLITFIELIKNQRYNFWIRSFIRCALEIEKLFDSVARSCGGPPKPPVNDTVVSAWISENSHRES